VSGGTGEYDPYEDVPEWTEEDEELYQARRQEDARRRRRRRRQGWSFAVLVLLVLGAGLGGAGIAQGWWEWPFGGDEAEADPGPDCSGAGTGTTVSLPDDVQLNVYNATDIRGLAAAVAAEMELRGYTVADVGNEESEVDVVEAVQIRYGPALTADAQSAALHFRGVVLVDDGRSGEVVDVVLGQAYSRMGGAEEAAAVIAASVPPGCAPTPSGTTPAPTATG
jgi:hypothetical protein